MAAGYARVAAHVGSRNCAVELLRRETVARKAKLGLWAGSYYGLLNADNPADVLAERGRFVLVEELAAMVAWLASEDCAFSTGAVFDISGGRATY